MNKKTDSIDRFADSMLLFGLGIAIFFWLFTSFLRFLQTQEISSRSIFIGNEYDLYEKLIVICLFIIFGSHAQVNIKQRKKAEKNLLESEAKYRSILETIEEGYYEVNLEGRFTFFNNSMSRMLASPRSELLAARMQRYLAPTDAEQMEKIFAEIRRGEKPATTTEFEFLLKGGGKKNIELSVSLVTDFGSSAHGIRGIARDVTEKRMLERHLLQSLEDVKEARAGVILGLAKLAEYRDTDTGSHLERIREFSRIIAEEMAKHPAYENYISPAYIDDIYCSAILHDIGKVGVPDAILLKPGRLTAEEFEIIKKHSLLGGQALSAIDRQFKGQSFLTIAKEIAYYHHERWDGTGYPEGLVGDQIPLSARIVAIADVYDALTSKRSYKSRYSHEKAVAIILEEKGGLFDPEIVEAFLVHEKQFAVIRERMHHDGKKEETS